MQISVQLNLPGLPVYWSTAVRQLPDDLHVILFDLGIDCEEW